MIRIITFTVLLINSSCSDFWGNKQIELKNERIEPISDSITCENFKFSDGSMINVNNPFLIDTLIVENIDIEEKKFEAIISSNVYKGDFIFINELNYTLIKDKNILNDIYLKYKKNNSHPSAYVFDQNNCQYYFSLCYGLKLERYKLKDNKINGTMYLFKIKANGIYYYKGIIKDIQLIN